MDLCSRRRSTESIRQMYNWFYRFYARVEYLLGPTLDQVVRERIATIDNASSMTAVDYACGSGLLTLKLAPLFMSVVGRDQSSGMLSRAQARAAEVGATVTFKEGNILEIEEEDESTDWAFVSFALHLFPLDTEIEILKNLLRITRQGVIVIDHSRKRNVPVSILEWLEGSWYDRFIKTDFAPIAQSIGAPFFEEITIDNCMVMTFKKS